MASTIKELVDLGYCVGCGACAAVSPDSLAMKFTDRGVIEAQSLLSKPAPSTNPANVCPFADGVIEGVRLPDEDELACRFLGRCPESAPYLGGYRDLWVGHSKEFRGGSSSGGIATWALSRLMLNGSIDGAICVRRCATDGSPFGYEILHSQSEVVQASCTRYYPVHMGNVIRKVMLTPGKYAIVGVPCFIKAIRLLQSQVPELRERISFCIGLVCGGWKSSFFTEYQAARLGVCPSEIVDPEYRVKNINATALDYSFACCRKGSDKLLTMSKKQLGDMWGTGLFKLNACDYCDDIFAENADLALGDAWIEPYRNDGRGTNMVVCRSAKAKALIDEGIGSGDLDLTSLPAQRILASDMGCVRHRQNHIGYRIAAVRRQGRPVPRKRYGAGLAMNPFLRRLHLMRMEVRAKSFEYWMQVRAMGDTAEFDRRMAPFLERLAKYTRQVKYAREPWTIPLAIGRKLMKGLGR